MKGIIITLLLALVGNVGCDHGQRGKDDDPPIAVGRWKTVKQAAESGHYSKAALTAVIQLSGNCPDRQYVMWKWWETAFLGRTNYMEMSRLIGESFFTLYGQSSPARRLVIAEIFGRPQFDIPRSEAEFRQEIKGKTRSNGAKEAGQDSNGRPTHSTTNGSDKASSQ